MIKNIQNFIIKHYIIFISIIIILTMNFLYITYANYYSLGRIDDVERIIKEDNNHKRKYIEEAMNFVEKKFNTEDFKGCILEKIAYTHGYSHSTTSDNGELIWISQEDKIKKEYDADEVIMLEIEYRMNFYSIRGSINYVPADIVCVYKNGKWEIVSWGLC